MYELICCDLALSRAAERGHLRACRHTSNVSYRGHHRPVDSSQSERISITTADNNSRAHAHRHRSRHSQRFVVAVVLHVEARI